MKKLVLLGWLLSATLAVADAPVSDGNGGLTFGGTGQSYSLPGTQVNTITFSAPGYTLGGYAKVDGSIRIVTDQSATLSGFSLQSVSQSPIQSPLQLIKSGLGTLTVSNNFAFNSPTYSVEAGELFLNTSGLGLGTTTLSIDSGAIATVAGYSLASVSIAPSGQGVLRSNTTLRLTTNSAGTQTFGGSIQDYTYPSFPISTAASVSVSNGAYALTGDNTYTGQTNVSWVVSNGVLKHGEIDLSGNGTLGKTGSITLNQGILRIDDSGAVNANRVNDQAAINLYGGQLIYQGNASTASSETLGQLQVYSGASHIQVTPGAGQTAAVQIGTFSRSTVGGTVDIAGTGDVVTTQANTNGIIGGYVTRGNEWASVDATSHVVALSNYQTDLNAAQSTDNVKLSNQPSTTMSSDKVINSLNLQNSSGVESVVELQGKMTIASGGILSSGSSDTRMSGGQITASRATTEGNDLIVINSNQLTIESVIQDSNSGMGLTKSGTGTLILSEANSYTGTTTVNEGTVRMSGAGKLGNGSALNVASGARVELNGTTQQVSDLQGFGEVSVAGGKLIVNTTTNSSASYYGSITGAGDFVKTGTGSIRLMANNTYTGVTHLVQGSLIIASWMSGANCLSDQSLLSLEGGTLTMELFGSSNVETGGVVLLSATSTISFSLMSGTRYGADLSFDDSHLEDWNPDADLYISGFDQTLDKLRFGTSELGLTQEQLDHIHFVDAGNATAQIDSSGYVTAVPEPGVSILLIVSLGCGVVVRNRRRRS